MLLPLDVSAQSSLVVEASPASQTQLNSLCAHLIPQRVQRDAATNPDPLGF